MLNSIIGVLYDGFAYGMLLFVLSVGLSVTLGMMNFVNLAHGAFAMLGGYVTVTLINKMGWPFLATLPIAFLVAGAVSVLFERTLYRRLYGKSDLDHCLLTIGIVFVFVASAAYVFGTLQQPVRIPSWLRGTWVVGDLTLGVYRAFLIAVGITLALALIYGLEYTRFGAIVRAAAVLVMFRQADGHDGGAEHVRIQRRQCAHALFEPRPVVQAGRDDELRVRLDAVVCQPAQLFQHVRRFRIAQTLSARLQIGGVHRHIQRRQALFRQAIPVLLRQIRERDVVAEEKRIAVVVVLDVQRAAHARRVLQNEAERAEIVAASDVDVERRMFEFDAELLAVITHSARRGDDAVAFVFELDAIVGGVELRVDHVAQCAAVYGVQQVAAAQAGGCGGGTGFDRSDASTHGAESGVVVASA